MKLQLINYDDLVYVLISMTRYMVDSSFPKLTRDDVSEAILKVQYDLSLAILNTNLIEN